MTVININGNTYSDDGSTPKDMNEGGFRTWLFPLIQDVMTYIAAALATLSGFATAAAASAASALNAPGTSATSTAALTIGYGAMSLTIQSGKLFAVGAHLMLASAAAPTAKWMHGIITSYDPATGTLNINVTSLVGLAASAADWVVSVSAPGSASLAANQYTGSQFYKAGIFEGAADLAAGSTVDLSTATTFTKTATANWALAVTGIPAGAQGSFVLELTNGGAFTFTPPAGTRFSGGVAPTLTVAGVDVLGFYKLDGGAWRMLVLGKDVK